jgi:hypothetical protein
VCIPTPTRASPACPASLFTVLGWIPFTQTLALSAPHPLSHVSLLFLLLISQFLFSPSGGQSVQGAMLIWPRLSVGVPHTAKLTWSASSQAFLARVTGGLGALLVSV